MDCILILFSLESVSDCNRTAGRWEDGFVMQMAMPLTCSKHHLLLKGSPTKGNVSVFRSLQIIKGFPPPVSSDLFHLCEFSILYRYVKKVILVSLKFSKRYSLRLWNTFENLYQSRNTRRAYWLNSADSWNKQNKEILISKRNLFSNIFLIRN